MSLNIWGTIPFQFPVGPPFRSPPMCDAHTPVNCAARGAAPKVRNRPGTGHFQLMGLTHRSFEYLMNAFCRFPLFPQWTSLLRWSIGIEIFLDLFEVIAVRLEFHLKFRKPTGLPPARFVLACIWFISAAWCRSETALGNSRMKLQIPDEPMMSLDVNCSGSLPFLLLLLPAKLSRENRSCCQIANSCRRFPLEGY